MRASIVSYPVHACAHHVANLSCSASRSGPGSKRGAVTMLVYLAEGAVGMPVFAGGTGGFIHLLGFTGGYLWSYPIAAFVVGLLCEKGLDRSFLTSAVAMLPGSLIIYAIGVPWLAVTLHLSPSAAILQGMVPFIPGDLFKLLIA